MSAVDAQLNHVAAETLEGKKLTEHYMGWAHPHLKQVVEVCYDQTQDTAEKLNQLKKRRMSLRRLTSQGGSSHLEKECNGMIASGTKTQGGHMTQGEDI